MTDYDEYTSLLEDGKLIEETVLNTVAKFLNESSKTGCSAIEMVDAVVEELVKMGFDKLSVENGIMAGMILQLVVDAMDSVLPHKRGRVVERREEIILKLRERLWEAEKLSNSENL